MQQIAATVQAKHCIRTGFEPEHDLCTWKAVQKLEQVDIERSYTLYNRIRLPKISKWGLFGSLVCEDSPSKPDCRECNSCSQFDFSEVHSQGSGPLDS